jgi:hypothetical protein
MRLVGFDCVDAAAAGRCRAVEGTVANLKFDYVFTPCFELLGHGEHGESSLNGEGTREITELYSHENTFLKSGSAS